MKFVITDVGQYIYGDSIISPTYINKMKDKYKLETIKIVHNYTKEEIEYTIVTINDIKSLVELQDLVGEFIIGVTLYLPEKIESIIDSTIVISDYLIE